MMAAMVGVATVRMVGVTTAQSERRWRGGWAQPRGGKAEAKMAGSTGATKAVVTPAGTVGAKTAVKVGAMTAGRAGTMTVRTSGATKAVMVGDERNDGVKGWRNDGGNGERRARRQRKRRTAHANSVRGETKSENLRCNAGGDPPRTANSD